MSCRAAPGGVAVAGSSRGRVAAVLVLAVLALLPGAAPAAAHDDLLDSTPREAQRLAALPAEVELEFAQPALAGYSAVAVTGPDGPVAGGEVVEDGVFVRRPVDPVAVPGEYVLAYRVVASDGHPVSGEITFTVTAPVEDTGRAGDTASNAATPSPAVGGTPTSASPQPPTVAAGAASGPVADDTTGPGVGAVAAIGTGGLLVAAAAALWLLRRRRPAGHSG